MMNKFTVLVAAEKAAHRFGFQELISTSMPGCDLITTGHADECLSLASSRPVDMVLVDIKTPDTGGLEICRRLKSDICTSAIPVLLFSDNHFPTEQLTAALEAGAEGLVSYDTDRAELMARLNTMLRSKQEMDKLRALNQRLENLVQSKHAAIKKSERARRTMSECNQALVRSESETGLIGEVCNILADTGGYHFVWAGFVPEDSAHRIHVSAKSGHEEDYLNSSKLSWEDHELGLGPAGMALRAGESIIERSALGGACDLGGQTQAMAPRQGSSIALLLKSGREIYGALSIYTEAPNAFDPEEVRLLEELSNDIAYGIAALRTGVWHKMTESALRLTNYSIDHAGIPVLWINAQAQIIYVNETCCRRLGYSREELTSMTMHDIDSNFPRETWSRHWRELKERGSFSFESTYRTKNGEVLPVEIMANYMEFEGNEYNFVFVNDITPRKQAENALRQSHKMEAMGTLAGGIAHDFNNILFAILGHAELAMQEIPKDNSAYSRLQEILRAEERAASLVGQILTFSRQTEQPETKVWIQSIAKETLKLLRGSFPSTIAIRERIKPKTGCVMADPTRIHQIIMNLCTNAYHAMRAEGGVLEVCLEEVEVTNEQDLASPELKPGRYVQLKISDTGRGVDPNIMSRIFDPYFTTKATGEGTGLGLATVHGIVAGYGGSITVESLTADKHPSNSGTTFTILLPRTTGEESAWADGKDGAPKGGSERILLVDDEIQILQTGGARLRHFGYRVEACENGADAIEKFKQNPDCFDIIITDQTMPGMTGYELSKEALRIRPDTPIILCTGYSEILSEKEAAELGIREYLLKPISTAKLTRTIRNVLDRSESCNDGGKT
ncbi:response regulator [Candidatus Hydrogenedentota bacterium]